MESTLVTAAINAVLGLFVWLLKRNIDAYKAEVDECKKDIKNMRDDFVNRREVDEIKADIKELNDDIKYIRENTIQKADFLRNIGEIKDMITDLRREK